MTNICQVGDRHQITEPRHPENPNKDRIPRKQWHACTHFQTTGNQRQKTFKADSKKGRVIHTETEARLSRFLITNCVANTKEKPAFSNQSWGDRYLKIHSGEDRKNVEWKR